MSSINDLNRILTPERVKILQTIRESSPQSISEHAALLGRDRRNVIHDLTYLKAHEDYDSAIKADASFWRPWFNKGNLLARDERRFHEALPYLDKAAELNPAHAEIFNNMGLTHEALGNYDDALCDFERAIGVDPKNADAHSNIGTLLYEQGRYKEAGEVMSIALLLIGRTIPQIRTNYQKQGFLAPLKDIIDTELSKIDPQIAREVCLNAKNDMK